MTDNMTIHARISMITKVNLSERKMFEHLHLICDGSFRRKVKTFSEGFESRLKHFVIYLFFQIKKKFKNFCLTFRSPLRKHYHDFGNGFRRGDRNVRQKRLIFFVNLEEQIEYKVKTLFTSNFMALRPWSFSMSLAPVALGNVLSWRETSQFSFPILVLSAVVVLSVHTAGNAVLAYRDLCRFGKDDINSPKAMVQFGALFYVLACISMLGVVCISSAQVQHLALLFFGGLSASFLDTGIVYFCLS